MRVIELACELAAKCSLREQLAAAGADVESDEAKACPADLHAANLWLPMLHLALASCRNWRLSKWQVGLGSPLIASDCL